jgi:hypothetical protein
MSLLVVAAPAAGVCALGILIALISRVFRSRRALLISFVFSAIASVPALWLLAADLKYLPGQIRGAFGRYFGRLDTIDTQVVALLVMVMSLLLFAWCAPVVQYSRLRSKPDDVAERAT